MTTAPLAGAAALSFGALAFCAIKNGLGQVIAEGLPGW